MSEETVTDLSNADVDDILTMIKTPLTSEATGKCVFVRKLEELPENVREGINIAVANPEVTNREILAFINTKTDVKVSMISIQNHRHYKGCHACLYRMDKT